MDREPAFYADTRFVVDGFHYRGHSGCSMSFDHRVYSDLGQVNSQAVEQNNRVLKRLVSSVSYMTPKNFQMVITTFISASNYVRRAHDVNAN